MEQGKSTMWKQIDGYFHNADDQANFIDAGKRL